MRQAITTGLEVAGMVAIAIGIAEVTGLMWLAWALSGVTLLIAGVVEGRDR